MQHGGAVLLLKLAAALALLALDALALGLGQHLLVLDAQLAAVHVHAIHGVNDDARVLGRLKVGKGEAAEDAIVKVVVEGVGLGQVHVEHDGGERLLAHGKGNVLDDNGRGDELVAVRGGGAQVGRRVGGAMVDAQAGAGGDGAKGRLDGEAGHGHGGVVGPVLGQGGAAVDAPLAVGPVDGTVDGGDAGGGVAPGLACVEHVAAGHGGGRGGHGVHDAGVEGAGADGQALRHVEGGGAERRVKGRALRLARQRQAAGKDGRRAICLPRRVGRAVRRRRVVEVAHVVRLLGHSEGRKKRRRGR